MLRVKHIMWVTDQNANEDLVGAILGRDPTNRINVKRIRLLGGWSEI